MRTTVLVDAWHLGGYSANRGIGTFLNNVLPRLADEPDLDVVGLATKAIRLPDGVRRAPIRRVAPDRFARPEHDFLLPHDLRRSTRRESVDVIFSPADNPPRHSPRPWVQTLHDLIPVVVQGRDLAADAARWRRIGKRLRRAQAVVTSSHNTAADAVRLLGVDPSRVSVAPLGAADMFRPALTDPVRSAQPTILYVGEYGPHKGFAEAFEVAGAIAEAGFPHRLAMVGLLPPWHEPKVRGLLASAPRRDRVDLLGYVPDLVAAYQRADALIVTSRYEGFCLPAIEAMACGTPVVAFSNSAITEVVGDGGMLVPDGDVGAMTSRLCVLLSNEHARTLASRKAIQHARRFSWTRCAAVHASVLRAAATER